MIFSEVSIKTSLEAFEAVSNICIEEGANGIEYMFTSGTEVTIKAYLPLDDLIGSRLNKLKMRVIGLSAYNIDLGALEISTSRIDVRDWAESYRASCKPLSIGEKFYLKPKWDSSDPGDRILIELNPGMAFGTGEHFTTKSSLIALEKSVRCGDKVADFGCGSGILSIASVKLGAGSVLSIDIDSMAIEVARDNLSINSVSENIDLVCGDVLNILSGWKEAPSFDTVVSNIVAEIIVKMTEDVYRIIKPGGKFIASGILKTKAQDVRSKLKIAGFHIKDMLSDGEWTTFIAQK